MKVLFFIIDDNGGIFHYTSMLANAVSDKVEVTIVAPKNCKLGNISQNVQIERVLETPVGFNLKKILFSCGNMSIVNKIHPDVIHITTAYPLTNFILRFFFKYPIVITVHDPISHKGETRNNWRSFLANMSEKLLLSRCDRMIVHGNILKQDMIINNRTFTNKISVIPHGDYSFFTKYKENKESIKNSILFFGRIVDYKGLNYLIRSIPLIVKEIPDVKLTIAGEGDISKYKESIKKNIDHIIVKNSYISDKDVATLFESTQLLILPYIEATQSGPLHIACAFKKPVVATNVGALQETVENGQTGIIVPHSNVNALAEAIIGLLKNDKLRYNMGENAYKKMKEDMSWDKIANDTIDVYKKVIISHSCDKNSEI